MITLRIVILLMMFVGFMGLCYVLYVRNKASDFDEAARLPLEEHKENHTDDHEPEHSDSSDPK